MARVSAFKFTEILGNPDSMYGKIRQLFPCPVIRINLATCMTWQGRLVFESFEKTLFTLILCACPWL
jgi:hypothetical protein